MKTEKATRKSPPSNDLNGHGETSAASVGPAAGKNGGPLDMHALCVLWLICSGANVEECLLEGNEMAGVNFGAFLPTDQKVLRLLLEGGAVEQADPGDGEYGSQVSTEPQKISKCFCRGMICSLLEQMR